MVVYLARVRASGRLVALKTMRAAFVTNAEALARFAREARALSTLRHPNIVRALAIEQAGDRPLAIVMEYLEGGTLREVLRAEGALSFERARGILLDLAEALHHAHALGIIHRDVKPENVFIEAGSGKALLSDFGIARDLEADTRLTLAGSAVGTPTYMSPEQIDGAAVDERSDIYSLGVLGWELLTGLRPWDGETLYGVIYRQKHDDLPSVATLRADTPAGLREVVERAMRKAPGDRWPNMTAIMDRLRSEASLADAMDAGSDDLPTLHFQRPGETLRGVPLAMVPSPDRPTLPVEREVRLRASREVTPPVAREPEVPPVVKEPCVHRPRLTQPRRRFDRGQGASESPAASAFAAAAAADIGADAEAPAAEAISAPAMSATAPRSREERRTAPRPVVAEVGTDAEFSGIAPPRGRNPAIIAIPSAIALLTALFLFARGRTDRETATVRGDTIVAAMSGGSLNQTNFPRSPARPGEPATTNPKGPLMRPPEAPPHRPPPAPNAAAPSVSALRDRIEDNDLELNRLYRELLVVLRAAGPGSGDTDAVEAMRIRQRAWLIRRDAACRTGTIDERAACFRVESRKRAAELRSLIQLLHPRPDSSPAPSGAT